MTIEQEWLQARYREELNSLYAGEIKSLDMLPQLVEGAQEPALKSAFQYHFEKSQVHLGRLHRIFANLSYWPVDTKSRPGRAPANEAGYPPPAGSESAASDDLLVLAARKLERREIAGYLLALNCAEILWDHAAADLLEKTLSEEYEIDQVLAGLSQPATLSGQLRTATSLRANPERVG